MSPISRLLRGGRSTAAVLLALAGSAALPGWAAGQTVYTWNTTTATDWGTATNWLAAGNPATNFPGQSGSPFPPGGSSTDVAQFSTVATNTTASVGLDFGAAGGLGGSLSLGAISVTQTTALQIRSSAGTGTLTLNGATLNSVANTLVSVTGANLTIAGGGVDSGSLGLRLGITNGVFNVAAGKTLTISSTISESAGTGAGFTLAGGGTLALTGSNTYSGATTIANGTVQINAISGLGSAQPLGTGGGAITLGSGSTSGTLEYTGASSAALSRDITVAGNTGVIANSGGAVLTLGGTLTADGRVLTLTGGQFVVTGKVTGATASSSLVIDNAVVTLDRSGAGNPANDYAGPTVVQNGGRVVIAADYLGASPVTATPGNIVLNGGTLNATDNLTLAQNRGISLGNAGGGTGTVQVDPGKTLTYGGALADNGGAGGLTVTGGGTFAAIGTSTYTGPTTLSGGVLSVKFLTNGGSASNIGASSSAAANLVIDGGTLRYDGGAASTDRQFTITANGGTLNASGTGPLTFAATAAVTFPASASGRTLTLAGSNSGANTLAAVVGDGGAGGATSLTKAGAGTWVLTGTSTYSGPTQVAGGVLSVGVIANGLSASGIGASDRGAANLVLDGGTLRYTGPAAGTDRQFTVGKFGGAVDASGSGPLTLGGTDPIILNNTGLARTLTLTGSNTGANTLAAVVPDAGPDGATSLAKAGTGTWVLTGTNTYTGLSSVSGGTLRVDTILKAGLNQPLGPGVGVLTLGAAAGAGTLEYTGAGGGRLDKSVTVASGGTGVVALTGGGSLLLTGTLTTDNATTRLSGGTFMVNGKLTGLTGGANLVVENGAAVTLANAANDYAGPTTVQTGGSVTMAGDYLGTAPVSPTTGRVVLDAGTLHATDNFTLNANRGVATGPSGGSGTGTITVDTGKTLVYDGVAADAKPGLSIGALVVPGGGTLVLGGANTYTGGTTVTGGLLSVAVLVDGGSASGVGASSNAPANLVLDGATLRYTGPGASTDRRFTVGVGGATLDASGVGAVTFSDAGAVTLAGTATPRTLTLTGTNGGANTLAASVGDNGTGATSLTKSGVGAWVLLGSSTYTGPTTIGGGVLSVAVLADGGLPSGIGASSNAAANLVVDGGTLRYTGPGASTVRRFTVTKSGGTLDASGNGPLTLTDTGPITFFAAPAGRTLTLSGSNAGANTLNATVGDLTGPTSLTKAGAGTWVLAGTSTYSGPTQVAGGVLSVGVIANGLSASGIGASDRGAANLMLDGGTLRYTGPAAGTDRQFTVGKNGGTIDASGSGAMNLAGLNPVTLSGGSLPRTLTLTGSNAGANTLAAGVPDAGAVGGGATSLTKVGSGTWVLTGGNTYTGPTAVGAGTLRVNGSIAGGTVDVNGASAVLGGTGTVGGAVTVRGGGTLAPGNSVGTLTVANSVTFGESIAGGGGSAGTFRVEISTDTLTADVLNVTGPGASLNFVTQGAASGTGVYADFGLALGDAFTRFHTYSYTVATTQNGVIQVNGIPVANGSSLSVPVASNYAGPATFSLARSGSNLVLDFTPVPEPVRVTAIFAAGLGGIACCRRRQRKSSAPLEPV